MIPRAVNSPLVTASRKRGHHPMTSRKVKVLEPQVSSKVQKDLAWLTAVDSLLDLSVGPSKARPTHLTLELQRHR